MPIPDEWLERDAVEEVFTAHGNDLYNLALQLCGDPHLAADATADSIAKVLDRRGEALPRQLYPYLRRVLVNNVNQWFRRRSVERAWARMATGDHRGAVAVDVQTVDRVTVSAALAELGVRQRTVLVLRYYEGLDVAETAAVMGVRVGTVKSQTSRAFDTLRRHLAAGWEPGGTGEEAARVPSRGETAINSDKNLRGRTTDAN